MLKKINSFEDFDKEFGDYSGRVPCIVIMSKRPSETQNRFEHFKGINWREELFAASRRRIFYFFRKTKVSVVRVYDE